jgi:hypothetical protein
VRFYLGVHVPRWLNWPEFEGVPLFVSANRLRDQKRWPKATTRYAIDSGGFSELSMHGRWVRTPEEYVTELRRWFGMLGPADWCAPQDWMCEPFMLKRTAYVEGLIKPDPERLASLARPMADDELISVRELSDADMMRACPDLTAEQQRERIRVHQARTVANFLHLRSLAPELPIVPVLQGWEHGDYLRHIEDYAAAGIDLASFDTVGIGSVCRRQDTAMAQVLMRDMRTLGIRAHGFGFKLGGLARAARWMQSADSTSWSLNARRNDPLPGCTHRNCANCHKFALAWYREKALPAVERGERTVTPVRF